MFVDLPVKKQKSFTVLEKKIDKVKADARKDAKKDKKGFDLKYVKNATENIQELYENPDFYKNQRFLLYRYKKLKGKINVWQQIFLPMFISVFMFFISLENLLKIYPSVLVEFESVWQIFNSFLELYNKLELSDRLLCITYFLLFVAFLAITVILICKILYTIINALYPTANDAVVENEMSLIKALLIRHKVLIDDETASVTVKKYF